jgi:hypothetical protein
MTNISRDFLLSGSPSGNCLIRRPRAVGVILTQLRSQLLKGITRDRSKAIDAFAVGAHIILQIHTNAGRWWLPIELAVADQYLGVRRSRTLELRPWEDLRVSGDRANTSGVSDSAECSATITSKQLDELRLCFWTLRDDYYWR